MSPNENKLDNPIWYSLSETHKNFAIDYGTIKFYHPDYCPFGGFKEVENTANLIEEYAKLSNNFFIFGEKPNIPKDLVLKNELVCLQMIIYDKIEHKIDEKIVELDESHLEDLLGLVKIVYPEYFKKKTAKLGKYYGIFKNDQLVAVTGERMRMNDFIEVSAVITHPDHIGKGYAKQLITQTVNAIIDTKNIPFLHVSEANFGAIKLYEKLGFQTRKKISIWNITK
jgi:ribosomal protein S18 acetylase RimI-like enzyme